MSSQSAGSRSAPAWVIPLPRLAWPLPYRQHANLHLGCYAYADPCRTAFNVQAPLLVVKSGRWRGSQRPHRRSADDLLTMVAGCGRSVLRCGAVIWS